MNQHVDPSVPAQRPRALRVSKGLALSIGACLVGITAACAGDDAAPAANSGGQTGAGGQVATTGGASTGGAEMGGSASGGNGSGGTPEMGGSAVGGSGGTVGSSGASNGGKSNDSGGSAGQAGAASGGSAQGGKAGAANGGKAGSAASGGSGGAGTIDVPPGYKLVWHDEFDVDGAPNPANWKFEKGFVRNEEAQWYQSNNASVQGGVLVIEARKERLTNPNYTGKGDWKTTRQYAEYTSSSMHTNGLQTFQYGRFEMRGRIPTKAGMWPAWWTLGVSGEWPSNGEIDIMEFYQGKVLANVACGTSTRYSAKWDSVTKQISTLGANWPSEFHTWRMDWDDQQIVLYLDDQVMNTTPLQSMLNADGTSPFKQKEYMLVNLAIGGMNGGDPSATTFPQRYEVDWIRVFQKQ